MADTRLTIHHCPHKTQPCSSYICLQGGSKEKYYVGNPYGYGHKQIFCEDCIRHLFANIPTEMIPGGESLEAKLRKKITMEYDDLLQQRIEEIKVRLSAEAEKDAALRLTQAQAFKITDYEPPAEESEEKTKMPFRCLDCGEDFDSKGALGEHKLTHAEPPKRKKAKSE